MSYLVPTITALILALFAYFLPEFIIVFGVVSMAAMIVLACLGMAFAIIRELYNIVTCQCDY